MEILVAQLGISSPWIVGLIEVAVMAILVSVCLVLISIPFAILHSSLTPVLFTAIEGLSRISKYVWERTQYFSERVTLPLDNFLENNRLRFFFTEAEGELKAKLASVSSQIASINQNASAAGTNLAKQIEELSRNTRTLDNINVSPKEIDVPDFADVHELQIRRRKGWTLLALAVPIGIGLIILNTWMLSLFFSELIEGYLWFSIGLRISHGLSFLFSLLEAALGIWIYVTSHEKNEGAVLDN